MENSCFKWPEIVTVTCSLPQAFPKRICLTSVWHHKILANTLALLLQYYKVKLSLDGLSMGFSQETYAYVVAAGIKEQKENLAFCLETYHCNIYFNITQYAGLNL